MTRALSDSGREVVVSDGYAILVTVGAAGRNPGEAAEALGVRHLVVDDLGCPMMRGRDYVAVQRDDLLVQTMWGWAGLLSLVAERAGVPCAGEVRATCVEALLERHTATKESEAAE